MRKSPETGLTLLWIFAAFLVLMAAAALKADEGPTSSPLDNPEFELKEESTCGRVLLQMSGHRLVSYSFDIRTKVEEALYLRMIDDHKWSFIVLQRKSCLGAWLLYPPRIVDPNPANPRQCEAGSSCL